MRVIWRQKTSKQGEQGDVAFVTDPFHLIFVRYSRITIRLINFGPVDTVNTSDQFYPVIGEQLLVNIFTQER